MSENPSQEQVFFFCEDCGIKNFLTLDQAEETGKELKFRCKDCNYLNTVPHPGLSAESS